jgi:hypothetical protein
MRDTFSVLGRIFRAVSSASTTTVERHRGASQCSILLNS